MTNYKDYIQKHGRLRPDDDDLDSYHEVELERFLAEDHCLEAINLIQEAQKVITGGDLYELEDDGHFRPTYDGWSIPDDFDALDVKNADRSCDLARQFVERFSGKGYGFVLVVHDAEEYPEWWYQNLPQL